MHEDESAWTFWFNEDALWVVKRFGVGLLLVFALILALGGFCRLIAFLIGWS